MTKSVTGNFFEDFSLGQVLNHAVPRMLTDGDAALYLALYGGRFPLAPNRIDEMLVFHVVFGKSVPDISLNAVANLGYAEWRFLRPVFAGDTLTARSTVIGLKQTSNGETGVVYVRTEGRNQLDETVLEFVRWVMVRKRDKNSPAPPASVPTLNAVVAAENLVVPASLDLARFDESWTGSPHVFDDYAVGEKIDHLDGMTVEEAEHQLATRLYQNTAKVHFNLFQERQGRFGRRLIYGGHVISLARALSFNGLANALAVVAVNGGRHVQPLFAGDTVFAWSEVLEKADLADQPALGALRLRTRATKDLPCGSFPDEDAGVILDFDYWVAMPRSRLKR